MNILQNRIESYENNSVKWPYTDKQHHKIETFAKAGFYFMRRPKATDSVRCFMCDIEISHWKQGQSPYSRHSIESPQCPWALLNFPEATNRSLTVNEQDPTTQPRHKSMRSARLATFNHHHYWPPNKSVKSKRFQAASKLADAGFYFTPNLENSARIKCPYCKISILEPERSLDALGKHKELKSTCVFFQRAPSIRSKHRRDTVTSTASNETFKTAVSQLEGEEEEEDDFKEYLVPKKRKATRIDEDDDSIWDINQVLDIPTHVRNPRLTYGNKSTVKRHGQRLLSSSGKRTNVNIFANLDLKTSSLIERPKEIYKPSLIERVDQPKPVPNSKKARKSAKRSKPEPEINTKEFPSPSLPSSVPGLDEILLMSPTFPPPERMDHCSLKEHPVQLNELLQASKPVIISTSPSASPSLSPKISVTDKNVDPVHREDKGKERALEYFILPNKPISLSKGRKSITPQTPTAPSSSTRTRNSEVSASIAKQMKYLQSTPVRSTYSTVNVMDIFGDDPHSPITSGHVDSNSGRTPVTSTVGRICSLITADGQRRALQPQTTATAPLPAPPSVLTLETNAAPLVTDEQKKMSVETYLQSLVDENITKVQEQGSEMIASIKERSAIIKQNLTSQKD